MRPARREEAKPWDPRPGLFPVALEMFEDPTRHRAWPCGRGSAKTTTGGTGLVWDALQTPGCAVIYAADTAGRAEANEWRHLKDLAEETGGKTNLSKLTIEWPNKSILYCTGADSDKIFNRKGRGMKFMKSVHLDECQDWRPEVLRYAVTKVFGPRLGDLEAQHGVKGRITMSGTGTMDSGFWYDVCHNTALGFGVTRADQWGNPHIKDPDGEFRAACKVEGVECIELTVPVYSRIGGRPRWVDCADPMMRREWFAEFNSGGVLQIFPVALALRVPRACLPTRDVCLVICIDFGTVDACSVGCWLYSRHDPFAYFVETHKKTGLSGSQQVEYGREWGRKWVAKYKPSETPVLVGDGGGLGKALIMDIKAAEGMWEVDAAEKSDKVPNIRFMAGDMRTGYARFVDDLPQEFFDTMKRPKWKDGHVGELIDGHMPDELDACYMGQRKVKELHFYEPPPPPEDPEVVLERKIRERMRPKDEGNPWA